MRVLVVDDSKTDILMIQNILQDYDLRIAYDGQEAMAILAEDPQIEIMILDVNMPRMNGFEVLEAIKDHPQYQKIATLILTNYDEVENEIKGLELGAIDYIRKPINFMALRKRIELHAKLRKANQVLERHNQILEQTVKEKTWESNMARDLTISALVSLLEIRNVESSNHTRRTQWMMGALCEHLSKDRPYREVLHQGYIKELQITSALHDIGKVGIPDSVLLKPGRFTPDEFEIMKKHTTYGVNALYNAEADGGRLSFFNTAIEIVGTHHEKFDGTGYPYGLAGEDIPLPGRLMAVIDVYDALSHNRVYRPAYSHEEALEIMSQEGSSHFDPYILDAFFDINHDIKAISDSLKHGLG